MIEAPRFSFVCSQCQHQFQAPDREYGEVMLIEHMKEKHAEELAKAGGAKAINFRQDAPRPISAKTLRTKPRKNS